MRKALAAFLVGGLVIGAVAAPALAKKPKKVKKPVISQVDEKLFLRDDDGCDTNVNFLSTQDGEDTGCWYVDTATY
ncbi:MAG: hypothetical protein M3290_02375, partial [Actinomycetota bacterium]|nr:hypothetical protein [Actinomycetota bacterium]